MLPRALRTDIIELELPLAEPEAEMAAIAAASGGSLGVPLSPQTLSEWCWTAVGTGIAHFYDEMSAWTQCRLASDVLGIPTCCTAPIMCNSQAPLEHALSAVGHLQADPVESSIPFTDLCREIDLGRPVACGIQYPTTGHFVVVDGYRDLGIPEVVVKDPIDGSSLLWAFDAFRNNYRTNGFWRMTYLTRG